MVEYVTRLHAELAGLRGLRHHEVSRTAQSPAPDEIAPSSDAPDRSAVTLVPPPAHDEPSSVASAGAEVAPAESGPRVGQPDSDAPPSDEAVTGPIAIPGRSSIVDALRFTGDKSSLAPVSH